MSLFSSASGRDRAALFVPEEARSDLAGVVRDEARADWVVLGDLGPGFTFERLNAAFRFLRDGSRLIALHRNPYWFAGERPEGIRPDLIVDAVADLV